MSQPKKRTTLRELIAAGVLSPPLKIVHDYGGRLLQAEVGMKGSVQIGDRDFATLSSAAVVAINESGMNTRPVKAINGWVFWKFEGDDGRLCSLETLRRRFRDQT